MALKYVVIAAVFFLGVAGADEALPPALEGKIDQEVFETAKNKSFEELKARCEKYGGPDAFDKFMNSSYVLGQCWSNLVNSTALSQEIEVAKPSGSVDEVFKKYCKKKPEFKSCLVDYVNVSSACLSPDERKYTNTFNNITEQLFDFVCFKEGDRIALFIAEGGPECFQDKREALQNCVNATLGAETDLGKDFDINELFNTSLRFDEKQCNQMSELKKCVVKVLETCPKPTSANIFEAMFSFIRKSTPCKNFPDDEDEVSTASATDDSDKAHKGSASTMAVTSATFIMAAATLLV